jgi:hypothetical protein
MPIIKSLKTTDRNGYPHRVHRSKKGRRKNYRTRRVIRPLLDLLRRKAEKRAEDEA